jgi:hypothetical protein
MATDVRLALTPFSSRARNSPIGTRRTMSSSVKGYLGVLLRDSRSFGGARVAPSWLPHSLAAAVRRAMPVAALSIGAAALLSLATTQVTYWTVMSDEMFYAKIATDFTETGSPLPHLHGARIDYFPFLYSLLIAPFYGLLEPQSAFHAAHVLNAFLMTSAAVPVYLLARELLSRAWSWAAALLALAVPWLALASFVMTEAAAYPIFLWAFLACHRALVKPSAHRDLVAIVALALAYLTRRQFAVLLVALPLALLLYELAGGEPAPVVARLKRAVAGHRLLAAAYAAGLAVLVSLVALGSASSLLGEYAVTATQGSVVTRGVWGSAAAHLDAVAIGLGVVPFVLGAGWIYARAWRAPSERGRAFGALAAVTIPLLALEAASFDLRFGDGITRDRYVFYLAPLLLVAAIACLLDVRPPWIAAVGATVFFAATVPWHELEAGHYFWVDSPIKVLIGAVGDYFPGLSPEIWISLCGLALGLSASAALAKVGGRRLALGVVAATFAFGGSLAALDFNRLLSLPGPDGGSLTADRGELNWIDRAVGGQATVGVIPFAYAREWWPAAIFWWDVEFWNRSVGRTLVAADRTMTYTNFPVSVLELDFATGRFRGTADAPPYVVFADGDPRFLLAGKRIVRKNGLSLLAVPRPYRTRWATRGLDLDGWTRPGRPVRISVYAEPGQRSRLVRLSILLLSPAEGGSPTAYSLTGAGVNSHGHVPPDGGRTVQRVALCLPAAGRADLTLRVNASAEIAGPPIGDWENPDRREVGALVGAVEVAPLGGRCAHRPNSAL